MVLYVTKFSFHFYISSKKCLRIENSFWRKHFVDLGNLNVYHEKCKIVLLTVFTKNTLELLSIGYNWESISLQHIELGIH